MPLFIFFLLLLHHLKVTSTNPARILPPDYGSNCEASCVESCSRAWGWEVIKSERHGDQCVYWSKSEKSWYEAEKYCRSQTGGHLASANNDQLHRFAKSKKMREDEKRWVGGVRKPGKDTWVWTDCSPWNYSALSKGMSDKETCVSLNANQKLTEESCAQNNRFVCSNPLCPGEI